MGRECKINEKLNKAEEDRKRRRTENARNGKKWN
jgi:hypothetical protein